MPEEQTILPQKSGHFSDTVPPREVCLKPFSESWRLWGRFVFGICAASLALGLYFYWTQLPFWAGYYGLPTEAKVTQKWVTKPYRNGTGLHLWLVHDQGAGGAQVSKDDYDRIKKGQKVQIHYFTWAPDHLSLDMNQPVGIDLYFQFALQGFFILITPVFVIDFLFRFRKQKYLLTNGKSVKGTIKGWDRSYYRYEFNLDNQTWKGSFRKNTVFPQYSKGDFVLVLEDPENPQYNTSYNEDQFFWKLRS